MSTVIHPDSELSQAQLDANRANAQKSTGPKSEAGKQASSRNSFQHGLYSTTLLLPEEDPGQYAALYAQYEAELHPEGLLETRLVEEMVTSKWKQIRLNILEQGVYQNTRAFLKRFRMPEPTLTNILTEAGSDRTLNRVDLVSRMESRLNREFSRAAKELRQLQKERKAAEPQTPPHPEPAPAPEPEPPAEVQPEQKRAERTQFSPHPCPPPPSNEGNRAAHNDLADAATEAALRKSKSPESPFFSELSNVSTGNLVITGDSK